MIPLAEAYAAQPIRAVWVVAITMGRVNGRPCPEWPLQFRVGLPAIPAAQQETLCDQLRALSLVEDAMVYETTEEAPDAPVVADINVRDPRSPRQTLRQIKDLVLPTCPYTAVVVTSLFKQAGDTTKAWVGIRDAIAHDERQAIVESLQKQRGIYLAKPCGRFSIELRVDRRWCLESSRFTAPLASHGVYPDFSIAMYVQEFGDALDPQAGF